MRYCGFLIEVEMFDYTNKEKLSFKQKIIYIWSDLCDEYEWHGLWGMVVNITRYWPVIRTYHEIMDWIRYRTYDKYHILKINTLSIGYHEYDEILLHANFEILNRFMVHRNGYFDEEVEKQLKELHHWWNHIYPHYDDFAPEENWLYTRRYLFPSLYPINWDYFGNPTEFAWKNRIKLTACEFDKNNVPTQYSVDLNLTDEDRNHMDESSRYEDKVKQEIEDKLIQLIKLRGYLWD